jgi:hypothetical protein
MCIGFTSRYKSLGWRGQLAKTKRWYERILHIGQQQCTKDDVFETDRDFDYIFAFFLNCYRLRDWLHCSDEVSEESKRNLKELFDNSVELQICRDICNGSKHCNLNKKKVSIDAEFSLIREYVPSECLGKRPRLNEDWIVVAGQHKYDLFELADKCWQTWQEFLSKQGLLVGDTGTP